MTVDELREQFKKTFDREGISSQLFPNGFEVDHHTYANVVHWIFSKNIMSGSQRTISITLGKHNGIMFKGVELILKKDL